jgi:hypothetical protein
MKDMVISIKRLARHALYSNHTNIRKDVSLFRSKMMLTLKNMVMLFWKLREHLDERGQRGELPYCSRKRGENHHWPSWSRNVEDLERYEDSNVPPGWRQFPNDLNEVEEQMAVGCYFGIEELEVEVPVCDRSKVPSLGYHVERHDNGDFVRIRDSPDFYIGAGEASVQACEWFDFIVATIFATLFAMDYGSQRRCATRAC